MLTPELEVTAASLRITGFEAKSEWGRGVKETLAGGNLII